MAWIHVHHQVADYDTWKKVYDETATFKRDYGWKRYRLFQVAGNRNDLIVMEEFESAEQAQRFLESPDLRSAMDRAGVTGPPQILVVEGLEEGAA